MRAQNTFKQWVSTRSTLCLKPFGLQNCIFGRGCKWRRLQLALRSLQGPLQALVHSSPPTPPRFRRNTPRVVSGGSWLCAMPVVPRDGDSLTLSHGLGSTCSQRQRIGEFAEARSDVVLLVHHTPTPPITMPLVLRAAINDQVGAAPILRNRLTVGYIAGGQPGDREKSWPCRQNACALKGGLSKHGRPLRPEEGEVRTGGEAAGRERRGQNTKYRRPVQVQARDTRRMTNSGVSLRSMSARPSS